MDKYLNFGNLKSLLVAVPAIHAFCCLIYLMFYDLRFGFRIWQFTSPSDIFSMSLGVVIPFYLSTALGVFSGIMMASPIKIKRQDENNIALSPKAAMFWIKNPIILALISIFLFCLIYLLTYNILISLYKSVFRVELIFYPLLICLVFFDIIYLSKRIEVRYLKHIVFYSMFGIIGVAFNGMMVAQKDATTTFQELSNDAPKCGKYVLLMPHGDSFIAARSDNARVLLNKACDKEIVLFDSSKFTPVTKKTASEAINYYESRIGLQ